MVLDGNFVVTLDETTLVCILQLATIVYSGCLFTTSNGARVLMNPNVALSGTHLKLLSAPYGQGVELQS